MDSFFLKDLKLHVIATRNPQDANVQKWQNRAYDFWHKLWLNTFNELTGEKQLNSDDFLRQDEYTFLTYKDEIISFHGYTFFNLNSPSHRQHSYFESYPADALKQLAEMNLNQVMVMGYFSVAPEWRKSADHPWIAEVQAAFAYQRFKESGVDTLITITRNNRKVNEMAARFGSRCLKANLSLHNVEVDLVYTLKSEVKEHSNPFIKNLINKLWRERIVHADRPAVERKVA